MSIKFAIMAYLRKINISEVAQYNLLDLNEHNFIKTTFKTLTFAKDATCIKLNFD